MHEAKGIYLNNVKSASSLQDAEKMLEGLAGLDLELRGIVFYLKFEDSAGYYIDSADVRLLNSRLKEDGGERETFQGLKEEQRNHYAKLVTWLNTKISLEPDKNFREFNSAELGMDLESCLVEKLAI